MTGKIRIGAILIVLMVAVFAAGQVEAAYPFGCMGGWNGYLPAGNYVMDSVPYYALHPPVYYSYPIPRPYGYSPYAYPPGVMTPERPRPRPTVFANSFCTGKVISSASPDKVAHSPLRMANPFVGSSELAAK